MDGDYPDLKALVALKKKIQFVLILDEAHGTGVFGRNGGGLADEMGVLPEIDILVFSVIFEFVACLVFEGKIII